MTEPLKTDQPGIRRFVAGQAAEYKTVIVAPGREGSGTKWSPCTFSHYDRQGQPVVILPDGATKTLPDGSYVR